MNLCFGRKDRYEGCRVLWSGERIGVVELWSWLHVYMYMLQIVGPRGMGSSCRSSISISFFHLPSFLPSCASRTTPFSQIHVQYRPYCTCNILLSVVDWVHLRGNMKFSWLLSFFLFHLSINQIIPTTNNTRFCMMIIMNIPKPTHQKNPVCVIIFFPSPTCTVPDLTQPILGGTLHYTTL